MVEKYDDQVFFTKIKGKSDVVCLKSLADLIVNCSWYEKREKDLGKEFERIINNVAKLFLSDIRSLSLESDIYPTENKICNNKICEGFLPESLRKFIEVLIKGRLKRSSVGQVINTAARLRSAVFPIIFELGVEMDNSLSAIAARESDFVGCR